MRACKMVPLWAAFADRHCQQLRHPPTHQIQVSLPTPALCLQEPVAAALAYGINGGTDGDTVLVVDVGGGTFDVRWEAAAE